MAEKTFEEIKKRLEDRGAKLIDMSDKIKSIGFLGGVASRQKGNRSLPEPNNQVATAPESE